ncbi:MULTISPECIES: CGNR zinc finger domain-containing protein [Actinoalloteichus]|uniref:Conserved protein containing a Zn-ribbon-like motif n=1 Tax=Actinoalloteichus fjordicus TaxID=1612552 RepID=A0AAC9L7F0_9PSEU|nr:MULTISPECIES: CGNR zinc finger domain-containing protein [Actinoalloteichus]APU12753.1 conserved protein containing a Zn-ribbon-like motif [Actinoalloteichus fjordicus]APU18724.1 conserved protein containing a Zn-ribbon-like motif [Actinoalloteichus sp. GBA129-24]
MSTGQWLTPPDGARWFFDSGSLALDFGYTGDYGYGVPDWELLHHPKDLHTWLDERFGPLSSDPTDDDLTAALRLRTSISRIATALADGQRPVPEDIDAVNTASRTPAPVPHLDGGTTTAPRPDPPAALSGVARDAIAVFGEGSKRIRRCGADDCALIFYDASRPGTRRWCSMRRCGNRTKVRNHRSQ